MKADKPECKVIVHPASLRLWVNDSWNIAWAVLWRNRPLKRKEILQAKEFIRCFYNDIPAAYFQQVAPVQFHHFCLCITDHSHVRDFNCSPALWFDPAYRLGFYSWIMQDPYFGLFASVN